MAKASKLAVFNGTKQDMDGLNALLGRRLITTSGGVTALAIHGAGDLVESLCELRLVPVVHNGHFLADALDGPYGHKATGYVTFPDAETAASFLAIAASGGRRREEESLYDRIVWPEAERCGESRWYVECDPVDAARTEFGGKTTKTRELSIRLQTTIRFPPADVPQILAALNRHRAHAACVASKQEVLR
jgi:hypothetical protein